MSDGLQTRGIVLRSLAALALLTAVRLAVAAWMPLSPDEAYYWTWSHALALGYLDHPPMVALWIRAGTALVGETALGVRLLGPLGAALGTVALADAGRVLFGRDAGVRAAVLLNATLMLGAGAVTMTPDTPLLFFWTVAVWAMARLAVGGGGRWWLVMGLAAGLALDSKYTAAFLGLGAAAWLLTPGMRHWLRSPMPWAGGAVALVCFAPVLGWNAVNDWASLLRQGGRVGAWEPARAARYLSELLGGQVGLATPIVFAAMLAGVALAVRRWRDTRYALLTCLVVPGAAVFVQHALGDRVQANWVAPLYPGAALAAAAWGRWWRPGAALGLALTAVVYIQATLAPLPLPRRVDPTLRLAGYAGLAAGMQRLGREQGAGFVASEEYGTASLLAWFGGPVPAIGVEDRWRLFALPSAAPGIGLVLVTDRRAEPPDPAWWDGAAPVATLIRSRHGVEAEAYSVYRAALRPGAPAAVLPRSTHHAASDP